MALRLLLLWLCAVVVPALGQHSTVAPAFGEAATNAQKFQLLPGLKLEVWAAEPQLSNSVAFAFDGRGRAYLAESDRWAISVFDITAHTNWLVEDLSFRSVADRAAFLERQFATNLAFLTRESEVVRRLEDQNGDGRVDRSEIIAEGFNSPVEGTAAGILATRHGVYFANIPSLWRLQPAADASNASPATTRTQLATGFGVHIGVSGHDLHGLIQGPDGRIYLSFGDRGLCLTNREGVVINLPDTGGVLRCEPDGSQLEVFCYGLRNPQELAFDDDGNLWTVDNDTAGADPCRVLHLIEGGDYGWRCSYQHMDGFGPWVQEELWKGGQDGILPLAGTVSQGPSGLAYYPGTGFGDRLKGKFLHCDFPGGVWSFSVKPRGASFEVDTKEKFLWNCWPTDVDFGPDGAAYVLDWVSGWGQTPRGRIYRLTESAPLSAPDAALVAEVKQRLAEGASSQNEATLLAWLDHTDRRVRLEAQWELANRGLDVLPGLTRVAEQSRSYRQRLHALWAIGQIARSVPVTASPPALEVALVHLLHLVEDPDHRIAATAARCLTDAASLEGLEVVTPLLNDPSPQVRLIAGLAVARMPLGRGMRTLPTAIDRIRRSINQPWVDQIAAKYFQSQRKTSWVGPLAAAKLVLHGQEQDLYLQHVARMILQQGATFGPFYDTQLSEAAHDPSPEIRKVALLAQRRLRERAFITPVWPNFPDHAAKAAVLGTALTNFLQDADPRLIIEGGRAVHDVPVVEGLPALASFITKIDCPTNLHSRVIDACFRLGTQQHAQMLASFAGREDVPDAARLLAIKALGDWEKPSPVDRVNGLWRPLIHAPARSKAGDESDRAPTKSPSVNPLQERMAQAQAARNLGRAAELPEFPADLGRSIPYGEGIAVTRNPAPARRAFLRVAGDLLNPFNLTESGVRAGTREVLPLQIAVVNAAAQLRVKEASTPLYEKFADTNTPVELRQGILNSLATLNAAQLPTAVQLALADPQPQLHAAALPYLDRLEGSDAVQALASLVPGPTNDPRLAQAALAELGLRAAREPKAVETLTRFVDQMNRNEFPAGLRLDLREAVRSTPLQSELTATPPPAGSTEPLPSSQDFLRGGNAQRGKEIFFHNATVQCLRCHQVGTEGGTVGPKLTDIGRRYPREYLLESIVNPNARLAAGFEVVVVTLKNGETHAGVVKREAPNSLVLEVSDPETGEVKTLTLRKSEVERRERGPSAMPEGLAAQLTPLQLRDLVEYLATLK